LEVKELLLLEQEAELTVPDPPLPPPMTMYSYSSGSFETGTIADKCLDFDLGVWVGCASGGGWIV
jgi:hypothetical protein